MKSEEEIRAHIENMELFMNTLRSRDEQTTEAFMGFMRGLQWVIDDDEGEAD
jgi:hypothetical protein